MTTTHTRTHVTPTRYFFDTEFMEDGERIELLSIGIVCEDGRTYYAESVNADWRHASEWVREHVLPQLSQINDPEICKNRGTIAQDIVEFVAAGESKPQFWAYYGDYDWVVLCQLFGTMMDLPKSWPMFAMDLKQLCVMLGDPELPKQPEGEHNALADARWNFATHNWLLSLKRDGVIMFDFTKREVR